MKKKVLSLVAAIMMITGTSLQANSAKENCITVTYSCGVTTDICDFSGTTEQLMALIMISDDLICP